MNPYMQLQMIQQAGMFNQIIPGMGGMMSPQAQTGGTSGLAMLANQYSQSMFATPGERIVDLSPMAGFGLTGPFAPLINIAGNLGIQAGITAGTIPSFLPMGNAGSYMQAERARTFQNMQEQVIGRVSAKDQAAMMRNIRGMAALAGVNMNQQQIQAAESLSQTMTNVAPYLGIFMPGALDSLTGETGSVQGMATQMMQANRYRTDPITGQLGYGSKANQALIEGVFSDMFKQDNIVKMQGLRAGDMGQLYSILSPEGLVGPRGNLRDRTIEAIEGLESKGQEQLRTINGRIDFNDLNSLSNTELAKLRQDSPALQSKITGNEVTEVKGQLQDYVESLATMREIFGEGGDPNAPMPKLIGALKSLTSNRMHQFSASQLNTMVRDMQALSQQSGKSVDQLVAMNSNNAVELTKMMGFPAKAFAPTVTGVGVATGQAFQQVGGAVGFGAYSRSEVESTAQSMMMRGLDSELGNTLGVMQRIEATGGFNESDAGKEATAAMAAIRQGKKTYTFDGEVRRTPTTEREFRSLISRGAVDDLGVAGFNMMLGDTFTNQEALFNDKELQTGAYRQQFFEYEEQVQRGATNRVKGMSSLTREEAEAVTGAALGAAFALTPEDYADAETRRNKMVKAILGENPSITEAEAKRMASAIYGQANQVARRRGVASSLALLQTQGPAVTNARRVAEARNEAAAGRNAAMAALGRPGSPLQRIVAGIQRAGDRGEDADLGTLIADVLGAPDLNTDKLTAKLKAVKEAKDESEQLSADLEGMTDPQKIAEQKGLIEEANKRLKDATIAVAAEGRNIGIAAVKDDFNLEDVRRGDLSIEEMASRRAAVVLGIEDRDIAVDTELVNKRMRDELKEEADAIQDSLVKAITLENPSITEAEAKRRASAMTEEGKVTSASQSVIDAAMTDEAFSDAIKNLNDDKKKERTKNRNIELFGRFQETRKLLATETQLKRAEILKPYAKLTAGIRIADLNIKAENLPDHIRKAIEASENDPRRQREILNRYFVGRAEEASVFNDKSLGDVTEKDLTATRNALSEIDSLAEDYLADDEAIASGGVEVIKEFQKSRERVEILADKFFKGDRALMYLSPSSITFSDEDRKLFEEEFNDLSLQRKQSMLGSLQAYGERFGNDEYNDTDAEDLTVEDYVKLKRMEAYQQVQSAREEHITNVQNLKTGAGSLKDETLKEGLKLITGRGLEAGQEGLDPTQLGALEKLVNLQEDDIKKFSKNKTVADYQKFVLSDKNIIDQRDYNENKAFYDQAMEARKVFQGLTPNLTPEERKNAFRAYQVLQEREKLQGLSEADVNKKLAAAVNDEQATFDGNVGRKNRLVRAYENLEELEDPDLDINDETTGLAKLDIVTDEYEKAGKDPQKKQKLAERLKMTVEDLDRMMRGTEFMGLSDRDVTHMSSREQAEFQADRLKGISAEANEEARREQKPDKIEVELTGRVKVEDNSAKIDGSGTGKRSRRASPSGNTI